MAAAGEGGLAWPSPAKAATRLFHLYGIFAPESRQSEQVCLLRGHMGPCAHLLVGPGALWGVRREKASCYRALSLSLSLTLCLSPLRVPTSEGNMDGQAGGGGGGDAGVMLSLPCARPYPLIWLHLVPSRSSISPPFSSSSLSLCTHRGCINPSCKCTTRPASY